MRKTFIASACTLLAAILGSQAAQANTVYNLSSDFSSTSNPNGVWTFGYETTLGGSLTDYVAVAPHGVLQTFDLWGAPAVPGFATYLDPSVFYNPTAATTNDLGGVQLNSHTVAFHPGEGGEYSVIQFTAPTTGQYIVNFGFQSADTRTGGETEAYIYGNGSALNSFAISSPLSAPGVSGQVSNISLTAGNTIQFIIAQRNARFYYDSTAIAANITFCATLPCAGTPVPSLPGAVGGVLPPVPEPSIWAMMLIGFAGLGFIGYRQTRDVSAQRFS